VGEVRGDAGRRRARAGVRRRQRRGPRGDARLRGVAREGSPAALARRLRARRREVPRAPAAAGDGRHAAARGRRSSSRRSPRASRRRGSSRRRASS
jgi:hypothetical protein